MRAVVRDTQGVGDEQGRLAEFLELWFGPQAADVSDPGKTVGRLLRFNRPVADTFDGDVQVLVVEQQGVWLWGRTADGRYVERENEPWVSWRATGESTEEFWLHHAAFEAATNLPAIRSAQLFDSATVESIKSETTPLPCKPWTWPGTRQYMHYRGSSVIMICIDGDDYWVVASAPTEEHLGWLDNFNLTWDESDTRRGLDH